MANRVHDNNDNIISESTDSVFAIGNIFINSDLVVETGTLYEYIDDINSGDVVERFKGRDIIL